MTHDYYSFLLLAEGLLCVGKKLRGTQRSRGVPFSESHRDNLSIRYRQAWLRCECDGLY